MKTAYLKISQTLLVLFFAGVHTVSAAGFLSLDADARYVNTDFAKDEFFLQTLGVTARQVIADETADRWVLYGQLEVINGFSRADFHQLYAMLKGPMGVWNVSAGRIRLPYGLLTGYAADHTGFAALDHYTIGIESDNGVMASGVIDRFTYAITVTRGAGVFDGFPEKGLLTGRLGLAFGESDDLSIGVSGAAGRTETPHAGQPVLKRVKLGAIDLVGSLGSTLFRAEITAGKQRENLQYAGFAGVDFSALSWLELNAAVSAVREADVFHHAWGFIGTTFNTKYLLLKGGYKYVHYGPIDHQVTLLAYKQFSFNF